MHKLPRPQEFITTKYMTRFSCLGPECEDSCCHWWTVTMERPDYMAMRKALSVDKKGKEAFARGVKRIRGDEKKNWFAKMEQREDGTCFFLTQDRLCTVHRDYGERGLCNGCSMYPRSVTLVGQRAELTGTLSCPEIARRCLLDNDGVELVDFDPHDLPRTWTSGALDTNQEDPYVRYFDDVRATIFGLIALPNYPVATRLFFVTYFANRVEDFFGPNKSNFSEARLAEEIDRMSNPEVLGELHRQFEDLEIPAELASALTQQLLASRAKQGGHPKFVYMVRDLYLSYVGADPKELAAPDGPDRLAISPEELWGAYQKRAAYWDARLSDRVDLYITNYAFNYWLKSWYTLSPSLLHHTRGLLISVAALRFLMFSDPTLTDAIGPRHELNEQRQLLDATAVRVTYLFTRHVEHNQRFVANVAESLNKRGITSFAHVVCLLKC